MGTPRRLLGGWMTLLALAGIGPGARAADEPKPATVPDAAMAARRAGIAAEFDAANVAFQAALEKAGSAEERRDLFRTASPDVVAYSRRMIDLAREKVADPAARDALIWVVDHPERGDVGPFGDEFARAGALLVRHHGDDPVAVAAGLGLDNAPSLHRDALLLGFYAAARSREAKGIARLALGRYLEHKIRTRLNADGRLPERRQFTRRGPADDAGRPTERVVVQDDESLAYGVGLALTDPVAIRAAVERLYEEVIADYADVPCLTTRERKLAALLREPTPEWDGRPLTAEEVEKLRSIVASFSTLGEKARGYLDEMRHVVPGKPAPEIRGTDLDGTPRALSDYRGKVVVLVFWGSWCGPCMGEVPHERELAEKHKDRPFAILGVDCNEDRAAGLKAAQSERMTWPSWNDGADGNGPIVRAYHVEGYPTVFVIDAQGVIRAKQVRGEALDKAVDDLLAAMEAKRP